MASHSLFASLAVAGWNLGLGWLLGRRWLLVSTAGPDGVVHRTAVRYGFAAGDFVAAGSSADPWIERITASPRSTVQAWPGPRAVRAEVYPFDAVPPDALRVLAAGAPDTADGVVSGRIDRVVVFRATGDRVPGMVPPDLIWVWPALLVLLVILRVVYRLGRPRVEPGRSLRR